MHRLDTICYWKPNPKWSKFLVEKLITDTLLAVSGEEAIGELPPSQLVYVYVHCEHQSRTYMYKMQNIFGSLPSSGLVKNRPWDTPKK